METYNLNADSRMSFQNCPRCGEQGYEKLRTHSHCVSCNYFDVREAYSYKDQALKCDKILSDLEAISKPSNTYREIQEEKQITPQVDLGFSPSAA